MKKLDTLKVKNHEVGIRALNCIIIGEYIYERLLETYLNKTTENRIIIKSLEVW